MDCQITPENRRRTLVQPWGWGGIAQYELSDKALHVRTEGAFTLHETTLPMHVIEPHPILLRDFHRGWALSACICWALTAVLVVLRYEVVSGASVPLTVTVAAGAAALAAIGCTLAALHSARHVIVFQHRYAGGPAVILDATRPSPETVEAFAAELDKFAHECDGPGGDREPSLADELRKLARLNAEGAITDDEFVRAKSQLLDSDERSGGNGGGSGGWEPF